MAAFRLGMAQVLVEGGRIEANLARAELMITRAADEGCAAVVLPECLDVGWTSPSARELAQPIPGPPATGSRRPRPRPACTSSPG